MEIFHEKYLFFYVFNFPKTKIFFLPSPFLSSPQTGSRARWKVHATPRGSVPPFRTSSSASTPTSQANARTSSANAPIGQSVDAPAGMVAGPAPVSRRHPPRPRSPTTDGPRPPKTSGIKVAAIIVGALCIGVRARTDIFDASWRVDCQQRPLIDSGALHELVKGR